MHRFLAMATSSTKAASHLKPAPTLQSASKAPVNLLGDRQFHPRAAVRIRMHRVISDLVRGDLGVADMFGDETLQAVGEERESETTHRSSLLQKKTPGLSTGGSGFQR